ncbi:MAG: hypothetical protein HYW86_01740 [Candidatus Roizmanbacteria bacterium]|nr:MAG: hypothetical protein HYW86_01740 [Candidatus Roizmanbacteria bacterium]
MTAKTNSNKFTIYLIIALLVGGLAGYIIGQNSSPFSRGYMNETASMMKDNGSGMMQMGRMMIDSGQMMQEKSKTYNDSEMMQKGKDLEINGSMMQQKGGAMMERGSGMGKMMGQ